MATGAVGCLLQKCALIVGLFSAACASSTSPTPPLLQQKLAQLAAKASHAALVPPAGGQSLQPVGAAPASHGQVPLGPCSTMAPFPAAQASLGPVPLGPCSTVAPLTATQASHRPVPLGPCSTVAPLPATEAVAKETATPSPNAQANAWDEIQQLKAKAPDAFPQGDKYSTGIRISSIKIRGSSSTGGSNGDKLLLSATTDGSKVDLVSSADGSGHQRWMFIKDSGGWYNIKVVENIVGGRSFLTVMETNEVGLQTLHRTDEAAKAVGQRWLVNKGSGDWYYIKAFGGSLYLGAAGGMLALFTKDNGSGDQRWSIPGLEQARAYTHPGIGTTLLPRIVAQPTAPNRMQQYVWTQAGVDFLKTKGQFVALGSPEVGSELSGQLQEALRDVGTMTEFVASGMLRLEARSVTPVSHRRDVQLAILDVVVVSLVAMICFMKGFEHYFGKGRHRTNRGLNIWGSPSTQPCPEWSRVATCPPQDPC